MTKSKKKGARVPPSLLLLAARAELREATEGRGRETKTVWELEEGGRLRKHFTPPPANSVGQRRNKKAGVKHELTRNGLSFLSPSAPTSQLPFLLYFTPALRRNYFSSLVK